MGNTTKLVLIVLSLAASWSFIGLGQSSPSVLQPGDLSLVVGGVCQDGMEQDCASECGVGKILNTNLGVEEGKKLSNREAKDYRWCTQTERNNYCAFGAYSYSDCCVQCNGGN
jgi:hypothetical protein